MTLTSPPPVRLGFDWGGTKMEVIALNTAGDTLFRERCATPRGDYEGCLTRAVELVSRAETALGLDGPGASTLGFGIPGSISPRTGLVKNANSVWLNGQPLKTDLEARLDRPVRIENDANCLAVSEATDGAAAGAPVVLAVIAGTGCGTGIAIDGKAHRGANGIAGEWGAIALPWRRIDEFPGPESWTGHSGAIDQWCSGSGFEWDHAQRTGEHLSARDIMARRAAGDHAAELSYRRHADRLARALAMATNILDPDVIVLGGGLSNIDDLYKDLPGLMAPYVMSDHFETPIRKARHGDSSGVRGAAWLWGQ
ncbi:ROK family protein [Roseibium aestuarii]|uniref:ROK family protein n=1 Tax=Roseibium aestuarii TaxID=2600299 RepID=A0ABW4JRM6_9HYPH|nr:ROK family protein [Roseibium aestuarii]